MEVKAFYWKGDHLLLLDQRELPEREVWLKLTDHLQVADAIKSMAVRGAPAIGCVASYGFILGIKKEDPQKVYQVLRNTRPTAYNLFWALERMMKALKEGKDPEKEAMSIEQEDYNANRRMGELGKDLIPDGANVLTHCNTGALATAGWGTALGVIRSAHYSGKKVHVFVNETRPYLQGSRLTAWELLKEGIPHTVITDMTAGFLMKKGLIDAVLVGADRITKRGDVANKIGTYTLSVLAKAHGVPFYVVAPTSTFDPNIESGEDIPIEERSEEEVKSFKNCTLAPKESRALHLAFDITPAENITAIITEEGIKYIKP
ncbi:S-methyl-5-thioribose-1-phosphate isomerase [Hydrogenobacter hydrogenophilus]|uniref:Methylthioribose-1-phosphate isomerase n=1 Tax=Hydrogenobacter hydrogenophilus TaxID=35835 RepID=A0A285NYX6_9AQUI|nr:S-methyl-5-thioribose-1-phosphate isomerase [Hydrogenobacter hydrogenophilus]SNZ13106.1 methylthioribose-1-phosphate isomerase [Hydrogenobacter hydrogenophilus]